MLEFGSDHRVHSEVSALSLKIAGCWLWSCVNGEFVGWVCDGLRQRGILMIRLLPPQQSTRRSHLILRYSGAWALRRPCVCVCVCVCALYLGTLWELFWHAVQKNMAFAGQVHVDAVGCYEIGRAHV